MSTNLHELTKQLDALTYNSRSVLNALIRSVMASGSSTGWTVERAGRQITMTRSDIFVLSSFYTEWEYTRFDQRAFDNIRVKLDSQFAAKGVAHEEPVTYAIVQHSKIMTMTAKDADVSDDEYWLKKVREQVNPKLFTNTAPIPVNIRTPIYDENLSTKHFDQFETYLFPRSYYTMDTLGYRGDNTSHMGGGADWFFDIDRIMTIDADRTVIGVQNPELAKVREKNYLSTSRLNSLAGGFESYAFAPNSLSFGYYNQVNGVNGAAVAGLKNFTYGKQSGIFAGEINTAVSDYSVIAGGKYNGSVGDYGFTANLGNSVGGYSFPFRRYVNEVNDNTVTDCERTITTEDGCVYNLQMIGSAGNGADAQGNLAPNQLLISKEDLKQSGFGIVANRITSAYEGASSSYADFKIGDTLRVYRCRVVNDNEVYNIGTYLERIVTGMEMRSYGLVVTFNNSINQADGIDGEIISGYVARYIASDVPQCYDNGTLLSLGNQASVASTVLGYNNVAGGLHQTVVGNSNNELLRPLFIVGNGSHYIDQNTSRHNAMVVAKNYTYLRTSSHYINFGISDYTTASQYVHGDIAYKSNRKYDEDYQLYGIEKYYGIYAYDMDDTLSDDTRAVLRVSHEYSVLGIGRNSVIMHPVTTVDHPNDNKILVEAESRDGSIGIHTGNSEPDDASLTVDTDWMTYYNTNVCRSALDKSIVVWAKDFVGIHGSTGIELHTSSYIHCEYGTLTMHGISLGALTADTSDLRGLMDFNIGSSTSRFESSYIKYPGHYFAYKSNLRRMYEDAETYSSYVNAFHILSNTHYIYRDVANNSNVWSTAQLLLPGNVTCGSAEHYNHCLPHPKFQVSNVHFYDDVHTNPTPGTGFICQELAYLADVHDLDKKSNGMYVGNASGRSTISEGVPSYVNMCDITFNSDESAYAGATLSFTIRDDMSASCQGFVTFSLAEHNMDSPEGAAIILFERAGHDAHTFDTDRLKIYVQKTGTRSCAIFYMTETEFSFVKTMKLVAGDASVEYQPAPVHVTVQPSSSYLLDWQKVKKDIHQ